MPGTRFLEMSHWGVRRLLIVSGCLHVGVFGLLVWEHLGMAVPFLQASLGFLCFVLLPGVLMLRVMRLHGLGAAKTLLLSIGLGVTSLMVIGLLINTMFGAVGWKHPLSLYPLLLSISGFNFLLLVIVRVRDRSHAEPLSIGIGDSSNPRVMFLSPRVMFLFALPLLTLVGTRLVNDYNNSWLLQVLIVLISIAVVLLGSAGNHMNRVYPLAIYLISLSLIYHSWTVSEYIWGRDIHSEYYFAAKVLANSSWDRSVAANTNAMLSVVTLIPSLSLLLGVNLTCVMKFVLPLIFALTPLAIYVAFKRPGMERCAFFASMLFLVMGFYNLWLISCKQMMGEFFASLLILLFLNKDIKDIWRTTLAVVFGFSLIVSHYGTSYIFMIAMLLALVFMQLVNGRHRLQGSSRQDSIRSRSPFSQLPMRTPVKSLLNPFYVLILFLFAFLWYDYASSSSSFITGIGAAKNIYNSIGSELLSPESAEGLHTLIASPNSALGQAMRMAYLFTQFLLGLGAMSVLFSRRRRTMSPVFRSLSMAGFALLCMSIVLPNFSSQIYTPRLYSISLVFLSPMFFVGMVFLVDIAHSLRKSLDADSMKRAVRISAVLIGILLLMDTGLLASVIPSSNLTSIPLDKERMMNSSNETTRAGFYLDYNVFEQDYYAAEWFAVEVPSGHPFYSDSTERNVLLSYGMQDANWNNHEWILANTTLIVENGYAYLGYSNTIGDVLYSTTNMGNYMNGTAKVSQLVTWSNLIYSSGGAYILAGVSSG